MKLTKHLPITDNERKRKYKAQQHTASNMQKKKCQLAYVQMWKTQSQESQNCYKITKHCFKKGEPEQILCEPRPWPTQAGVARVEHPMAG